jgi:hypothetical protein
VGIKMSGVAYGAAILAILVLLQAKGILSKQRPVKVVPKSWIIPGVLMVIATADLLLVGGFWYIRNWLSYNNPLGFVRVSIAGRAIFPGLLNSANIYETTLANVFKPGNAMHWRIFADQVRIQLNVPFLLTILLSLFGLIPFALSRRQARSYGLSGLLLLIVAALVLFWLTPYSGDNGSHQYQLTPWIGQGLRYAIPAMALLAVLAAAGLSGGRVPDELLAAVSVIACTLMLAGTKMLPLANETFIAGTNILYTLVALLLLWPLLRAISSIKLGGRLHGAALGFVVFAVTVLLVGGVAYGTASLRSSRAAQRNAAYFGVPAYIAHNVGSSEVIGYVQSYWSYPFFGQDLSQRVVYVPATTDDPAKWLQSLRAHGVSIVAIGPFVQQSQKESREFRWLEQPGGSFTRIFGQDPMKGPLLYRLNASSGATGS